MSFKEVKNILALRCKFFFDLRLVVLHFLDVACVSYEFNNVSLPLLFSFFSIEERTLQAALLVPTTFLNATDRIFLSSSVSSSPPNLAKSVA